MLVVVALGWHLEDQPRIHLILKFLDSRRFSGIILDDNNFEQITLNTLLAEIVQNVKALSHTPIHQDQAYHRTFPLDPLNKSHHSPPALSGPVNAVPIILVRDRNKGLKNR